jgi:hypothetical protein
VRLRYASLADAAVALEGKFYINGGDLTRVTPPVLPWVQSLALCLSFDPEDDLTEGTKHEIQVTLTDPEGNSRPDHLPASFVIPKQPLGLLEGEPRFVLIAFTLTGLAFHSYGLHRFEVALDGAEHVELPLAVVPPPSI